MNQLKNDKLFDHQNSCMGEEECSCGFECRNKPLRYTILIGIIYLIAFVIGFLIELNILKALWLISTGTMVMISVIIVYLLFTKVKIR